MPKRPILIVDDEVSDDENYWHTVETYFAQHTQTRFSHNICPSCLGTATES